MRVKRRAECSGVVDPFGGRWRWLGQPGFLVAVFVLAVNDHVLKGTHPGWVTGKLSDVAGVAVAGTVFAVLVGPRRGLVLTGIGFVALKVVPHVAEVASPLLGGVTGRDTSDLIALVVLVPLWFILRAPGEGFTYDHSPRGDGTNLKRRDRLRVGAAAALPIIGAVTALVTTTATSCSPRPAVTVVSANQDTLFAAVSNGWGPPEWAVSTDGGSTWGQGSRPPGTTATTLDVFADPGPTGQTQACAADGTCWRIRDRRIIERQARGTDWVEEVHLSDSEFNAISTGCVGGQVGVLSSIAVVDTQRAPQVVASLGAEGVMARQGNGQWARQRVLSAPPAKASAPEQGASGLLIWFGPLFALALWLVGRRWLPSWRAGLAVVGLGWLTTIMAAGALGLIAGTATDPDTVIGRVGIAGMLVTAIATVIVARRPRRLESLPPPPSSLPPPPTSSPPVAGV